MAKIKFRYLFLFLATWTIEWVHVGWGERGQKRERRDEKKETEGEREERKEKPGTKWGQKIQAGVGASCIHGLPHHPQCHLLHHFNPSTSPTPVVARALFFLFLDRFHRYDSSHGFRASFDSLLSFKKKKKKKVVSTLDP